MESVAPNAISLVLTLRRQVRHKNSQPYRDGDTPFALMHSLDATLAGVNDGDLLNVASSTGCLTMTADVTEQNVQGSVSVPHGWADTNVNIVISAIDLDPLSGMPRMSGTAVSVTRRES
jgi:anaerobic selenocysteine-containing dehydrogenase